MFKVRKQKMKKFEGVYSVGSFMGDKAYMADDGGLRNELFTCHDCLDQD